MTEKITLEQAESDGDPWKWIEIAKEQIQKLDDRLTRVDGLRLADLEREVARNSRSIGWGTDDPTTLGARLSKIERRLGYIGKAGSLNDRIAVIEEKIAELDIFSADVMADHLNELKNKILDERIDFALLSDLEKQVDRNEGDQIAMSKKLAGAIADGKELGERLTAIERDIETLFRIIRPGNATDEATLDKARRGYILSALGEQKFETIAIRYYGFDAEEIHRHLAQVIYDVDENELITLAHDIAEQVSKYNHEKQKRRILDKLNR